MSHKPKLSHSLTSHISLKYSKLTSVSFQFRQFAESFFFPHSSKVGSHDLLWGMMTGGELGGGGQVGIKCLE